jgi:hypothetical protein
VYSAGFKTTVFPAASAGAKPQLAIGIGKFHGTITPTKNRDLLASFWVNLRNAITATIPLRLGH